jgi:hypothetical protein
VGCRQHVPVWHDTTRQLVKDGKLVLLGVTQEQHAERCRLFAQWKQFDWPILYDPINVLEADAVPVVVAIDEYGIVRSTRPRRESLADEFVNQAFTDDAPAAASPARYGPRYSPTSVSPPSAATTAHAASERLLSSPLPQTVVSTEPRRIEFEVKAPATASGKGTVSGYALFHICDETGGTCRFARLDVTIDVPVATSAGSR